MFRLYAAWGLDFIKVDDLSVPYSAHEIEMIHKAIDKCGRPIVFSTSPGATDVAHAAHIAANANMWRISGDFWDRWKDLDHAFDLVAAWQGIGGPGHWPDADMIPFGHLGIKCTIAGKERQTRFTPDEQRTLMSLWTLAPSPLMLGANLTDLDKATLALLNNDEVIALNQDPLGQPARRVTAAGTSRKFGQGSRQRRVGRRHFQPNCESIGGDCFMAGSWFCRSAKRPRFVGAQSFARAGELHQANCRRMAACCCKSARQKQPSRWRPANLRRRGNRSSNTRCRSGFATPSLASGRIGGPNASRKMATGMRAACIRPGDWQYQFHTVHHYGSPMDFGFKDVIHSWHAENWDPEKLVELYKRAGAQYFFALANHHDNFDPWDSTYRRGTPSP